MAIAANLAALAVLLVMGNRAVAHLLVRPLEIRDIPAGPLPQADAIVVLGGVTGPAVALQPTIHLRAGADRLTYGAELYRAHKAPLVVLSGGGNLSDNGLEVKWATSPGHQAIATAQAGIQQPSAASVQSSVASTSDDSAPPAAKGMTGPPCGPKKSEKH